MKTKCILYFHRLCAVNIFSKEYMMSEKSQRIKLKQSTLEDSDEESNQLDLSQLRKPIVTSVTGFEEIIKAYGEGTEEVSHLYKYIYM